jgi:hypothetical protein
MENTTIASYGASMPHVLHCMAFVDPDKDYHPLQGLASMADLPTRQNPVRQGIYMITYSSFNIEPCGRPINTIHGQIPTGSGVVELLEGANARAAKINCTAANVIEMDRITGAVPPPPIVLQRGPGSIRRRGGETSIAKYSGATFKTRREMRTDITSLTLT